MIEWAKMLETKIFRSNKIDAIRYLRNNKVNYESKSTAWLHQRNRHLMSFYKALKEERNNGDMRSYIRIHEDVD